MKKRNITRLYLLVAWAFLCTGVWSYRAAAQELVPSEPNYNEGEVEEIRPVTCPTWTTEGFLGTPVYPFGGYLFVTPWTLEAKFQGLTEGYYHASPDPNPKDIFKRVRWYGARIYVTCKQYVLRDLWGRERFGANIYDAIEGKEEGTIRPCSSGSELLTYDPYNPDDCSDETPTYPEPGGGGGSSGGGGDSSCHTEYIVIEISYDDGATWETYWAGYAQVCE